MPLSNLRVCSLAIAGCLLSAATIFAASDGNSTGDMDLNEIGVLDEVNLARTKPAEYANYVEEHKKNFKGFFVVVIDGRKNTRTVEGLKAVDEAIAFLKTAGPMPALSPSRALTLAARDHVKDLGLRGTTGHIGTDNSQPADRIRRYGTPKSVSGEDITFGSVSARSIVVQLIVMMGWRVVITGRAFSNPTTGLPESPLARTRPMNKSASWILPIPSTKRSNGASRRIWRSSPLLQG